MNSFLKTGFAAVAVLAAGSSGGVIADQATTEHTEAARAAAQQLGKTLKARLITTMKADGPVAAVTVCAEDAYAIAATVSEETGMDVGRRALRLRDPGNAPDAWEREVLSQFLAAQERGEDLNLLEHSEVVTVGGEDVFYWAKPILLEQPCTICHGSAIAPELAATIADYYPDDQATGFAVGDLRGIFSVKKRLP